MTAGCAVWVARYQGPGRYVDGATSLALSPDGARLYVTGYGFTGSAGIGSDFDYATVAYDAATGSEVWVARYDGPGNGEDAAWSIGVSPDGSRVYVTGYSYGPETGYDYATVAYDAATGSAVWVARYDGLGNDADAAVSLAVSPDGARVYVTGASFGSDTEYDYATVAYDAATGGQAWVARYGAAGSDVATALSVTGDGSRVYVTGASPGLSNDYATVAYDAANGTQRWVARYRGAIEDIPSSIALSPTGARVYVTGKSLSVETDYDYATVAYDAATGIRAWVARFDGTGAADEATSLGVSPEGGRVYVTGYSGTLVSSQYATVAYDAGTGAQVWVARYDGPGVDVATALAVSGDGSRVYVTGRSPGLSDDYATLAYDAPTGKEVWLARYDGLGPLGDVASSVLVSPDGARVYVTGSSSGSGVFADYVTAAYRATGPGP